jgi:glycerophosphoryl diester phosphodiesterase
VRAARVRGLRGAVARRERARRHGREVPARLAPGLWQRFLVIPVLTIWEAITRVSVGIQEALMPPPRRILAPPPADAYLVVGHRGAPVVEVENTIPSFERALREGANAIEVDLCVTRDQAVVAWHDWDPDEFVAFARQAGAELDVQCRPVVPPEGHPLRRPVCDLTLDEFLAAYGYAVVGGDRTVSARIPLLEDVVEWAAGRPDLRMVVLDLKIPLGHVGLARIAERRLAEALERHPCGASFVWLSAFASVLDEIRGAAPASGTALDVELKPGVWTSGTVTAIGPALEAGRAAAGLGRPRFTVGGWRGYARAVTDDLRRLSGRGVASDAPPRLLCWTINRRSEMRRLLRLGVSAFLTDRAALLRSEVRRALLR